MPPQRGPQAGNLRSLQRIWNDLARRDPLWAVLTAPDKRGRRWDPAEFFRTGAEAVEGVLAEARARGLTIGRRRALDFGCGVGRLTQALAPRFDEVWGVDIAPAMIELAESYNRYGERCRYLVNEAGDLGRFPDGYFDFILSLITLQHMPPDTAKSYLKEFVRVLVRGGVLIFQAAAEPTAAPSGRAPRSGAEQSRMDNRAVTADRDLLGRGPLSIAPFSLCAAALRRAYRKLRCGHLIDMYGIPRQEVTALLSENGASLVLVLPDTSAGREWTSFHYFAQKQ
jgi:SAM-dependent methyltransferase